jgi:hypothetical protein
MEDDAVEAVECLKGWQRDGMIAATMDDIGAVEEIRNALCEEDLVYVGRWRGRSKRGDETVTAELEICKMCKKKFKEISTCI